MDTVLETEKFKNILRLMVVCLVCLAVVSYLANCPNFWWGIVLGSILNFMCFLLIIFTAEKIFLKSEAKSPKLYAALNFIGRCVLITVFLLFISALRKIPYEGIAVGWIISLLTVVLLTTKFYAKELLGGN